MLVVNRSIAVRRPLRTQGTPSLLPGWVVLEGKPDLEVDPVGHPVPAERLQYCAVFSLEVDCDEVVCVFLGVYVAEGELVCGGPSLHAAV